MRRVLRKAIVMPRPSGDKETIGKSCAASRAACKIRAMLTECRLCGSDDLKLWMREGRHRDLDYYRCGNCTLWAALIVIQIRTRRSGRNLGHLVATGNPG